MSEPVRQAVYFSRTEIGFILNALNRLLVDAQKEHWGAEPGIAALTDRVFDIDGFWVEPTDKEREATFLALTKGEANVKSN